MTLNEFRTQEITWDKASKKLYTNFEASSGDSNGRKLSVQVIDDSTVVDLTGVQLNLAWQTKSGTKYGLDSFEATDATKGIFEIFYTTEMLSNVNTLNSSFVLIDSLGRIESDSFEIVVKRSNINDNAIQSSNSFTALTSALVEVNGWNKRIDVVEKDYEDRASVLEETYAPRLTEVATRLVQKVGLGTKAELEDLSETVLSAIEGGTGTTFELTTIPQDFSVTPFKTDFLEYGANISDANNQVVGKALDGSGTTPFDQSNWAYLEISNIKPNTKYEANKSLRWEGWNDTFINGTGATQSSTFTTGLNVDKLKVAMGGGSPFFNGVMISESGKLPLEFESFEYKAIDGNNFYTENTKENVLKEINNSLSTSKLLPTIDNTNLGKVILPFGNLIEYGNNNNPFTNDILTNAKAEGLGGELPFFIPVYKGTGVQAIGYGAFQGYTANVSKSISDYGVTAGDSLSIIFFVKHNLNSVRYKTSLSFGGTAIELSSGNEVVKKILSNGYTKYTVAHVVSSSEITNGIIGQFVFSFYASDNAKETQYMYISAPLIYLGELNTFGLYDKLTHDYLLSLSTNLALELTNKRWYGKKFYFCGDSITENRLYQSPLSGKLKLGSFTTDGNPGSTISGCVSKIVANTTLLDGHDTLTIFAGTNDFGGNKELGNIDSSADINTTYGSLKLAISTIQTAKPNLRIVLITPLPRGKFDTQPAYGKPNGQGKTLTDYVNAIREVGAYYHIPVMDLYNLIGWNEFNISNKTGDNLHPNEQGNVEMVPVMSSFMELL